MKPKPNMSFQFPNPSLLVPYKYLLFPIFDTRHTERVQYFSTVAASDVISNDPLVHASTCLSSFPITLAGVGYVTLTVFSLQSFFFFAERSQGYFRY